MHSRRPWRLLPAGNAFVRNESQLFEMQGHIGLQVVLGKYAVALHFVSISPAHDFLCQFDVVANVERNKRLAIVSRYFGERLIPTV